MAGPVGSWLTLWDRALQLDGPACACQPVVCIQKWRPFETSSWRTCCEHSRRIWRAGASDVLCDVSATHPHCTALPACDTPSTCLSVPQRCGPQHSRPSGSRGLVLQRQFRCVLDAPLSQLCRILHGPTFPHAYVHTHAGSPFHGAGACLTHARMVGAGRIQHHAAACRLLSRRGASRGGGDGSRGRRGSSLSHRRVRELWPTRRHRRPRG